MQEQLTDLLKYSGSRITKWNSNGRKILDCILQSERSKELKNINIHEDFLPVKLALRMEWKRMEHGD